MYNCTECGQEIIRTKESQRYRYRKTGRIFCSKECGKISAGRAIGGAHRAKPIEATCSECGGAAILTTAYQRTRLKKGERVYCGEDCAKAYMSRRSSETMARTNRKYASARMTKRNPMSRPEIRAKVSESLKAMGHEPKLRGGNGRPATDAEVRLVEMFGPLGFKEQCIVNTKMPRGSGYPFHYKVDCGNTALRIGIEADGASHASVERRRQDAKKDRLLTGMGWRMFRFKNAEILTDPDRIFETVLSAILERH